MRGKPGARDCDSFLRAQHVGGEQTVIGPHLGGGYGAGFSVHSEQFMSYKTVYLFKLVVPCACCVQTECRRAACAVAWDLPSPGDSEIFI